MKEIAHKEHGVPRNRNGHVFSLPVPVVFSEIDHAVAHLDAWFETMRGPDGYGGPVAHWWQQCLLYTGAGLDWRYEGIITGYLQLWAQTRDERWLVKACYAGDDLMRGQLENGHYQASTFEMNPATGGTPHEAACDVGLLMLAQVLRQESKRDWQNYAVCAERNLQRFYIEQLWDTEAQSFRDDPNVPSFVPNKAATACEALFLLAEITEDEVWVERYVLPTLNRILEHQVQDAGRLDGAIAQNSFGTRRVEKYFPIYIARCIPALLRGSCWTGDESYAESALRAMRFIARWVAEDGSLPTVVYPNQRVNRYPSWIAPLGDVLRAADAVHPYGFDANLDATRQRLLKGQDATGGIQTATGFAAQIGGRPPRVPDMRDVLHVVGWCDKAFRYLAAHIGSALPPARSGRFEAACTFQGHTMHLVETPDILEVSHRNATCYRWHKGATWTAIAAPKFWLH